MRGVYTISAKGTAVVAAKTLLYIDVPANCFYRIISAKVSNSALTNQQLECTIQEVNSKTGAAGATPVVRKSENGDSTQQLVMGTSALAFLTTEPASYQTPMIDEQEWASLTGYSFDPVPESWPLLTTGKAYGIRLITTPASSDFAVELTVLEIF